MRRLGDVVGGRTLRVIGRDATAREAAAFMTSAQVSALPVVAGNRLVGIVTERDLVQRLVAPGLDPAATPVGEVMSTALLTARPGEGYEPAIGRMKRNHVRHLLVVSGDRLVGVVSMRDLLVVDAVEKTEEIELLTSYIYAVPPALPPFESLDDDWAHTL